MIEEPPAIIVERYLHQLRCAGELAAEMGVSRNYLAMRHHGFKMPGGKASLRMARAFIETCDEFKVRAVPMTHEPPC